MKIYKFKNHFSDIPFHRDSCDSCATSFIGCFPTSLSVIRYKFLTDELPAWLYKKMLVNFSHTVFSDHKKLIDMYVTGKIKVMDALITGREHNEFKPKHVLTLCSLCFAEFLQKEGIDPKDLQS